MRVAIPLYGNRVSPRFTYAEYAAIADIRDGQVAQRETLSTGRLGDPEWLDLLSSLGIDIFVCGAINPAFLAEAGSLEIHTIPDVAGELEEVLELLAQGRLLPGHGTYAVSTPAAMEAVIDCTTCLDRVCLTGAQCAGFAAEVHGALETPEGTPILDVATDIACENERRLCRVAELVHFCHGMNYEHIGLAFCVDMFRETQILTHLLRRYLRVTPVCCKIGGKPLPEPELAPRGSAIACSPLGQAAELNRVGVDINVIAGLCMGCDVLFTRHSIAPVTTLFVKDRSLANNPVGALYSHYYLTELVDQTRIEPDVAVSSPRQGDRL